MIAPIEELNFSNIFALLATILLLAVIIFLRYLIFSGAYHFFFFKLFPKTFKERFLKQKKLKKKQQVKEIYWSALSGLIFGAFMILCVYLWKLDVTLLYKDLSKYTIWYLPVGVFLFLFLQDTYYYWAHRWMHNPRVYKYFHLVHHKSIHTSVWTSFSFHPLETILQALFLPIVICVLPMHFYAVVAVLIIMTISATINHAGVEIYPSGKLGKKFRELFIGATHHDLHHTKFNYNYGLYFTFWDRVMKTEFEGLKKKLSKNNVES